MSVYFRNTYWLLGDGADAEAQRWVAEDKWKKIVYSSPRAVEMEEIGNHLPPHLPVPPEGFVVAVITENEVYPSYVTLGVSGFGEGGWITPRGLQFEPPEHLRPPQDPEAEEFLKVLREMPDKKIEETPP